MGQKTGKKIIRIINTLHEDEEMGVTEVAERLDIAKSTAHYHLDTLCDQGYVAKSGSQYRLSLRFLRIGELARSRVPIYEAGKEEITQLANETGELAILGVKEQGLGVYLDKKAGADAIDIDAPVGRSAPLHNRAYGKAILAHLDNKEIKDIIDEHGLSETSSQTITDRGELFEELEQIRNNGFALNKEESIDGLHGVAVPILDNNDTVLGALSLAGPSKRLSINKLSEDYVESLSKSRNIIELSIQDNSFNR